MIKKIFILIFLVLSLSNCSDFKEMNERIKGDGVPYIPGV